MGARKFLITKQLLLFALTFVLSMCLFTVSYRCDNKYKFSSPQPIGGILLCPPQFDQPVYLINGWEYYKNRLLTPEDFKSNPIPPDQYVFIGQHAGMEAGNPYASPHGSATYRMTLSLPETPAIYTLELPELYSAYRLYVGERLMASQGNPDAGAYRAALRCGFLTFEASGDITLLLAVSDWSHLYSGLVYPPAFGTPKQVNSLLDQRFAWSLAVTVLAILLGVFQTAFFAVTKSRRPLLSGLMCLSYAVFVSSPVLHRLVTTGITPFYNLEIFCRYAIYGFAVLLVHDLCKKKVRINTAVSFAAMAFPAVALLVSIAAPDLTLLEMTLFSHAAGVYKILCSLWLTITVFYSGLCGLKEDREDDGREDSPADGAASSGTSVLLVGICVLASSLAADRLYPLFEPIRFGWFSEIAGLIFVLLISALIFYDSFRIYRERCVLSQQKEQLKAQVRLQKEHYTELVGQMQTIRTMRHDMRHHFTELALLLQNKNYAEAGQYLNRVNGETVNATPLTLCENYTADVLLRYYYTKAQQEQVSFQLHADLPADSGISDEDLSVILGNVLEKALEANLRLPKDGRFLSVTILKHFDNLLIEASNTFNGELETSDGNYLSSKKNGRLGIGISSVRAIAERYDGNVWIDTCKENGGSIFTIHILLITREKPHK